MANSNRVFVSPGVYTSEKDLTFVAQSVGVTTLGLVGETLKGPAFEPVLIGNFDEFKTYFGGTLPVKDGAGNPKYELPYVAKSYLQESNQLFVTRVLGLTGYKPNKTFGIKTLGGINVDLTTTPTTSGFTMVPTSITGSTVYSELSGKTSVDGTSITDYIVNNFGSYGTGQTNNWFTIGLVPDSAVSSLTGVEVSSPLSNTIRSESNNNKEWFNVFFNNTYDKVFSYLFVWNGTGFTGTRFSYSSSLNTDYDGIVVAALRSRGSYSGQSLNLQVTSNTGVTISSNTITSDPLSEFTLNVVTDSNVSKTYTCSLSQTSSKFISKVLGGDVFDKNQEDFPLYVHEVYPRLLKHAYDLGLIRGISLNVAYNSEGSNYAQPWDTTISPTVVSEVRGGKVDDLFQVQTISDGESANYQVKIMIQNVNLETGEFDMIVRDYNDTDENMVALERFTRCSMNPDLPGYVARKVGTSDGEYELRSKYIMLIMNENHPTDAFPCGFKGFQSNSAFSGSTLGSVFFKTSYLSAGDIISYESDGTPIFSNGDKIRKVSLGISSQIGFDRDLLKYKGAEANGSTFGFHLSSNAESITDTQYQCTPYDLEGEDKGLLENINNRKFTFAVYGGRDGWDIYRSVRTNGDGFIFNKNTYNQGSITGSTLGVFSNEIGNSDYYAYLQGIETFSNPEAVDINVFATPGINFQDHSSLTTQAVDMIENERADSLYIVSSPNLSTADEVIDSLDTIGIDSNYSATYWPWIQIRDVDNATQLYLPPTGEVVKNIALTDNVSYPWFAVAGYSRGLVNAIKASKKLTLDERDELYKNRINPIATFSDTGTIIWGNKTLQVRESALDRINVRRLLLRARKLISAVAVRLLFEQNDEQVRNEFLRLVNPILESIKKERGLFEFRVSVSNDPEDLDANTLRGKIYIKPTRSLEFIDLEFIITPSGASFENI
jgi:hypothetical protein